jgi:hypothetical protein
MILIPCYPSPATDNEAKWFALIDWQQLVATAGSTGNPLNLKTT